MSREIGSDLCLLKYIHEEMNCEWDEAWAQRAGQEGNLYALRYLHENGCLRRSPPVFEIFTRKWMPLV